MASANLSAEALFGGGHMETDQQLQVPPPAAGDSARTSIDGAEPPNVNNSNNTNSNNEGNASWVPRPKRVACVVCRKRKLRCDGMKPSCGSCARLGHDCAYNEVRKKSGPKRGYVKQLEARLAQVETLLKTQDGPDSAPPQPSPPQERNASQFPDISLPDNDTAGGGGGGAATVPEHSTRPNIMPDVFGNKQNFAYVNPGSEQNDFTWEMIGLGLEEPLPVQEVIDDLTEIYFNKIHPSLPIIHKPRYYAAMNLAPSMRPPICLRYIMWTHAAIATERYQSLHEHFYQRARKYATMDEMKGLGENVLSVAHSQCWSLITMYEFKMMYFPRAWLSCGKSSRLSVMLGLHRQDGVGLDVKQCLPPARDWTEREERRRAFWASFCQDRYASVGTGWPMAIDEKDILTNLPATDYSFVNSKPQQTPTLADVISGIGVSSLSPYGAIILLACVFGRNLHHLHRASSKDKDHDLNGEFWKRHRALDNILLSTSLSLPSHLRLPEGVNDPCVVFANMCIHTSTISLHQAAIFKAEKNDMPAQIAAESKRRCIIAADQITNIMKMISHLDLTSANPFLSFCLYVASRIFIQYLKSRPDDSAVLSALQFMLSALHALKQKNPLTESFIVQLDVDLEGSGIQTQHAPLAKFSGSAVHCANPTKPPDPKCFVILNPPEISPDDPNPPSTQGQTSNDDTSTASHTIHPFSSLPTRQKPSQQTQQQTGTNSAAQLGQDADMGQYTAFYPSINITDDHIRSLVMELDGSTEVSMSSDRQQSGSDHATPHTNKSSNSSYSPQNNADQPSPPKQQQQQQANTQLPMNFPSDAAVASASAATCPRSNHNPNLTTSQAPHFNPTASADGPYSYYTTNTEVPLGSVDGENPFSLPAGWNYPVPQPNQGTVHSSDNSMAQETDMSIPSLDGVGWAPTPGSVDWNNWTHQ